MNSFNFLSQFKFKDNPQVQTALQQNAFGTQKSGPPPVTYVPQETTSMKYSTLPEEELRIVLSALSFQDLCRCSQVNKQWNTICKDILTNKVFHNTEQEAYATNVQSILDSHYNEIVPEQMEPPSIEPSLELEALPLVRGYSDSVIQENERNRKKKRLFKRAKEEDEEEEQHEINIHIDLNLQVDPTAEVLPVPDEKWRKDARDIKCFAGWLVFFAFVASFLAFLKFLDN